MTNSVVFIPRKPFILIGSHSIARVYRLGNLHSAKMATRFLARSLLTTKPSLSSAFSHSCGAAVLPNSSSFIFRLRPIVAAASASYFRRLLPAISTRAFSTRQTASSLNDPNPNWSNRPPKETILLDGCDFEHWLVVVEKPEGDPTRDEIIDSYIKTLATVIGRFGIFRLIYYQYVCELCFVIFHVWIYVVFSET